MVELYHWEDDPEAERVLERLSDLDVGYKAHCLDAEIPNATPHVCYKGKAYWDFDEFLEVVAADHSG
jgi:hypothetical protein